MYVQTLDSSKRQAVGQNGALVAVLSSSESVEIASAEDCSGKKGATSVIDETTTVLMELSGEMLDKERKRLEDKQASFPYLHQNSTW